MDGKINLFIVFFGGARGTVGKYYEMEDNDTKVYQRITNACNEALTNKEKIKIIQFNDEDIENFTLETPIGEYREGCIYDFTE